MEAEGTYRLLERERNFNYGNITCETPRIIALVDFGTRNPEDYSGFRDIIESVIYIFFCFFCDYILIFCTVYARLVRG